VQGDLSAMSNESKRASAPIVKLDIVNNPLSDSLEASSPQQQHFELAQTGATELSGMVAANSRSAVDEVLKQPGIFYSADLIEEGNTRPLIPLGIDPPDHAKYRRLLDPLFSARRIDALGFDITNCANRFIDAFIETESG
jgi:cytochrome P450